MNIELLFDKPIAFHRPLVSITGSVTAALLLSQAIYWSKRCSTHADGSQWFYKTQADWEEETGLTRYEQESARKSLRDKGIIKEKRVGIPAKLFFTVDFSKLSDLLESHYPANKDAGKPHTVMLENGNQDCGNPADSSAEKPRSNTEITTETTTEITTEITKTTRKQKNTFSLPAGLNLDAWNLWKCYRSENNLKAYKPVALGEGAAASKLISLAGGDFATQMLIVKQSIENQWQGLFALKQQRTGESKIAQAQRAAEQAIADGRVGYDYDTPFGKR